MSRLYLLDAADDEDLVGEYLVMGEDATGYSTNRVTLAQLCKYLFNGAAVSEGSPFDSFNFQLGSNNSTSGDRAMSQGYSNTAAGGAFSSPWRLQ
jgi:hypothetical protein